MRVYSIHFGCRANQADAAALVAQPVDAVDGEQEVVDLKATQPRSCDSEVSCLLFEAKEMALPKKEKRRCFSRRQYLQDASCLNRILIYKNDFVEAS